MTIDPGPTWHLGQRDLPDGEAAADNRHQHEQYPAPERHHLNRHRYSNPSVAQRQDRPTRPRDRRSRQQDGTRGPRENTSDPIPTSTANVTMRGTPDVATGDGDDRVRAVRDRGTRRGLQR